MLSSFATYSCSPLQSRVFQPNEDAHKWHTNKKTGFVIGLPKLEVVSVEVNRGGDSDGVSCIDAGSVIVKVKIPEGSPYKFEEFGVYLKSKNIRNGENPLVGHQVPLMPVEVKGRVGAFMVAWVDGHPKYQKPIDMTAEVISISNLLQLGPSVEFQIKSEKNG